MIIISDLCFAVFLVFAVYFYSLQVLKCFLFAESESMSYRLLLICFFLLGVCWGPEAHSYGRVHGFLAFYLLTFSGWRCHLTLGRFSPSIVNYKATYQSPDILLTICAFSQRNKCCFSLPCSIIRRNFWRRPNFSRHLEYPSCDFTDCR